MNGSVIASNMGQSRTRRELAKMGGEDGEAGKNPPRTRKGTRQNRHQSQEDASIAAAVPISVVTSAPLARMLGLRQYIAQAAVALRGP